MEAFRQILFVEDDPYDLDECYKLGVNAYVVKPVRFTEFINAVKGIGVFWALINEPPLDCASQE